MKTIERYGYKNTASSAGSPTKYKIKVSDICRIHKWYNFYGNPSYGFIMVNGDTYLLIDDFGALNGIGHISARYVNRKKDLV